MSLFSELKRRNVFRVGLAYLAGAWLLIQIADTVFPAYGFSPFLLDSSSLRGIHGPDERIPIEAFRAGITELERVVSGCVME